MNMHAAAKSSASRLEAARRTIRVCKRREPQTQDLSKERWISRRARSPCSTADSTERNLRTMTTWSPTRPGEASYYDQLFQLASQGSGTEVTGQQAVDFFGHAGVAVTYLRDVWNVACQPNRVSLGKTDFYVAMRLLAMAQAGMAVSKDALVASATASIPMVRFGFDGAPQPPQQSKLDR